MAAVRTVPAGLQMKCVETASPPRHLSNQRASHTIALSCGGYGATSACAAGWRLSGADRRRGAAKAAVYGGNNSTFNNNCGSLRQHFTSSTYSPTPFVFLAPTGGEECSSRAQGFKVAAAPRGRGRGGPLRGRRGPGNRRSSRSPSRTTPPEEENVVDTPSKIEVSYPSSPEFRSVIQSEVEKLRQGLEREYHVGGSTPTFLNLPSQSQTQATSSEVQRLEDKLEKAEAKAELAQGHLRRVHGKMLELRGALKRGNLPMALRQLSTVLQASGAAVKELIVEEHESLRRRTGPLIIVKYVTSWNSAFLHFSTPTQGWTEVPGIPMADGLLQGGESLAVKIATVNAESLEFVVTDGQGLWDKAPDGGNYQISQSGEYILQNGSLKRVEG